MFGKTELDKIRTDTGNFYDSPPSIWRGTFWQGNAADAPKITAADRVVMRQLYKNSRLDKTKGVWVWRTSVKGAAKLFELD